MKDLTQRQREILEAILTEFMVKAGPVGSRTIARKYAFDLSPATIRGVMADLEDMGLLAQPHTSAGRVPTDHGYRCYVDVLLHTRRPGRTPASLEAGLRERAGRAALMDDMLSYASHVVSEASHHVGFALGPQNEAASFHQIDFVPLAGSVILVVVVARGGQVSQKVVDLDERFDPTELRQAANYLNSEFAGRTLAEVRTEVLKRLQAERTLYDALLSRALRLAQSTFQDLPTENPIFIEGAALLLDEAIESSGISIRTMRALLTMVEEKHRLVRLLTEYIDGPGLTVVIGSEHTAPDLRQFSLVASTYSDGGRIGSVGVIGPTRMRYSRAILLVEGIAQAMSRVLSNSGWATEDDGMS